MGAHEEAWTRAGEATHQGDVASETSMPAHGNNAVRSKNGEHESRGSSSSLPFPRTSILGPVDDPDEGSVQHDVAPLHPISASMRVKNIMQPKGGKHPKAKSINPNQTGDFVRFVGTRARGRLSRGSKCRHQDQDRIYGIEEEACRSLHSRA